MLQWWRSNNNAKCEHNDAMAWDGQHLVEEVVVERDTRLSAAQHRTIKWI